MSKWVKKSISYRVAQPLLPSLGPWAPWWCHPWICRSQRVDAWSRPGGDFHGFFSLGIAEKHRDQAIRKWDIMGISWKKIMELLWDTNLKYFLVWHLELDFLSSWPWPQRESPNPELAIFIFQQAMAMRTTRKVIVGMCYPIYPLVI